jgi:LPS-assembly protein
VEISGRLLGVHRENDATTTADGVPYVFGYAGNKQHASFQAGWQTQWIAPGGIVATPYLGGRADLAYYNGDSDLDGSGIFPAAPEEATLFSATPIGAIDVRYPLMATSGSVVHIVEPIGQLVYRGSDTTAVGITNDDAQSFVLDDTNLFSFNRFSGSDRQETGLRANIGARYQADFIDGSYLEIIAGQSFQLAGENAFAAADPARTGQGSGLDTDASYAVLGAYGSFGNFNLGGKLQVDPDTASIARAGLLAGVTLNGISAELDYHYLRADPELGIPDDQHEIGTTLGVPIAEYWRLSGNVYWDLASNTWLQVGGGVVYDDGYLELGASAVRTGPTHDKENDTRFLATFRLKSPSGLDIGYSGSVPGL